MLDSKFVWYDTDSWGKRRRRRMDFCFFMFLVDGRWRKKDMTLFNRLFRNRLFLFRSWERKKGRASSRRSCQLFYFFSQNEVRPLETKTTNLSTLVEYDEMIITKFCIYYCVNAMVRRWTRKRRVVFSFWIYKRSIMMSVLIDVWKILVQMKTEKIDNGK